VTRTPDLRFRRPPPTERNSRHRKDLRDSEASRSAQFLRAENSPQNTLETCREQSRTGLPPDLAEIAAAWPHLPEAVKAGILAMVKASAGP